MMFRRKFLALCASAVAGLQADLTLPEWVRPASPIPEVLPSMAGWIRATLDVDTRGPAKFYRGRADGMWDESGGEEVEPGVFVEGDGKADWPLRMKLDASNGGYKLTAGDVNLISCPESMRSPGPCDLDIRVDFDMDDWQVPLEDEHQELAERMIRDGLGRKEAEELIRGAVQVGKDLQGAP